MHAWGDGKALDVRIGTYDDEKAAIDAALRFRKRFSDSIDAMMLYREVGEPVWGNHEEETRTNR